MRDWQEGGIDEGSLDPNPIVEYSKWYEMACASDDMLPEAAALATVDKEGRPSVRVVLIRGTEDRGFEFYTNYESDKAKDIEANPRVALSVHWKPLYRQIRIEGIAKKVSLAESQAYWESRPRGSRLAATVSRQSEEIDSWEQLKNEVDRLEKLYPGESEIPLPDYWGGYRVEADRFEFWLSRPSRLHDRFLYTKQEDSSWRIVRLAP